MSANVRQRHESKRPYTRRTAVRKGDSVARVREKNRLSNNRSLAARIEAAREKERTELARELHDELGQTLTGLKLELTRTFRDLIARGLDPGMLDRVQSMVGAIELATEIVRRM